MLVTDPDMKAWLAHRFGSQHKASRKTRGFSLNKTGNEFIDTFGKKRIQSFVGFVDLQGFSTKVRDKSPEDIATYLKPFLKGVVEIVVSNSGMVDKTIGDEIMFSLPDPEEDWMPGALARLTELLCDLHDLAFSLSGQYQFRIGLSHGDVVIDLIDGEHYSEWTLFGETVHVAKRLVSLDDIAKPNPILGAFGLKAMHEPEITLRAVGKILDSITSLNSKWAKPPTNELVTCKGVENIAYGIFKPRENQNT